MVSWPQSRMGTSGQQEHVIYKSLHCVLTKNQRKRECRTKSRHHSPMTDPFQLGPPPDFCHLPLTPSHSRSTKGLMNSSGYSQSHRLWRHLHRHTQGCVLLNIWEFFFKKIMCIRLYLFGGMQIPKKATCPETVTTGHCELPNMDIGNQIEILCKTSKHS